MSSKKSQYHTKKVSFHGKEMTLYSLDGVTWSTRPDELEVIIQRHSTEQAAFTSDLKGEEREKVEKVKPKHKKFARVHDDGELDEIIEEDAIEDLDDDLPIDDIGDDVDDLPVAKGKKDAAKAGPKIPPKAASISLASSKQKKIEKGSPKAKAVVKAAKAAPSKSAPVKGAVKSSTKKAAKPSKAKNNKAAAKSKKPIPAKGKKKAA